MRGGIDLGGTKIQTVVVDDDHDVRGAVARADADDAAGRPTWPPTMAARAPAGRGRARASRPARWPASASARPATSTTRRARSRARATCPAGRAASRWPRRSRGALGAPGRARQRRPGRHRRRVRSSAPASPYRSLLGVFWGTGVGGGIVLDGKPWLGRGAAGEIGHIVVKTRRRALPVRAARLHGGLRRPLRSMELRARPASQKGEKTALFEIMRERGRDAPDQRRLGARAGPRRRRWRPSSWTTRSARARRRRRRRSRTCSTSRRS